MKLTIYKFVPLKKNKENSLERNTCKKKLFEKLWSSKTMWRVYRRTRKDEDNANYEEALNAATEI